jgi:hypothetical protein
MESNRGIDEALPVSFELRLDTLERLLLGSASPNCRR